MKMFIILTVTVLQFTLITGVPDNKPAPFFETVNYNVTHLKSGDNLPTKNAKLRLYGMRFCPFTEKVVLVLNDKKLEYDLILINLQHKPDWFYNINQKGTVPVLEIEDGTIIIDSTIISVYLDEQYPDVPLQAAKPLRRAQDKIIAEIFSSALAAFNLAAYHPSDVKPSTQEDFHKGLQYLEKNLESRNTKYLFGNEPGLVDFTIWPFLVRFQTLPILGRTGFEIDEKKYILLTTYMAAMKSLPAAKGFYLSPEIQAKFMESKMKSKPDFDLLTH